MDIIKGADHIIDLGPDGGDFGGEVIVKGNLNQILKCKNSYTAKFLNEHLKREKITV